MMYRVSNEGGAPQSTASAGGHTGSSNWYQKLATAWGSALDRQADHTADLATQLSDGKDGPGAALRVSAAAHQLSFLSTAAATASNSIGQALETLGKKQ